MLAMALPSRILVGLESSRSCSGPRPITERCIIPGIAISRRTDKSAMFVELSTSLDPVHVTNSDQFLKNKKTENGPDGFN